MNSNLFFLQCSTLAFLSFLILLQFDLTSADWTCHDIHVTHEAIENAKKSKKNEKDLSPIKVAKDICKNKPNHDHELLAKHNGQIFRCCEPKCSKH